MNWKETADACMGKATLIEADMDRCHMMTAAAETARLAEELRDMAAGVARDAEVYATAILAGAYAGAEASRLRAAPHTCEGLCSNLRYSLRVVERLALRFELRSPSTLVGDAAVVSRDDV